MDNATQLQPKKGKKNIFFNYTESHHQIIVHIQLDHPNHNYHKKKMHDSKQK